MAVLTVAHVARNRAILIVSFRRASGKERGLYDEWIENEYDEPSRVAGGGARHSSLTGLCLEWERK
jgi:hypothetical protein